MRKKPLSQSEVDMSDWTIISDSEVYKDDELSGKFLTEKNNNKDHYANPEDQAVEYEAVTESEEKVSDKNHQRESLPNHTQISAPEKILKNEPSQNNCEVPQIILSPMNDQKSKDDNLEQIKKLVEHLQIELEHHKSMLKIMATQSSERISPLSPLSPISPHIDNGENRPLAPTIPPPPPPPPSGKNNHKLSKNTENQKKNLNFEELTKKLISILSEEKSQDIAKKIADIWTKKFSPKALQKIIEDYPFLIEKFALQPQVASKKITIWEKQLFSTLDEKNAKYWRNKKRYEIEKFEEEEILVEIPKIKKLLEKKLIEEREAEKAKAVAEIQGQLIDELKIKIKNRSVPLEPQEDDQQALLQLMEEDSEPIIDF